MNTTCFLVGHRKVVQGDDKTVVCSRCNKTTGFYKKGCANIAIALESRHNGVLGFLSEPMNWLPCIVIALFIHMIKVGVFT